MAAKIQKIQRVFQLEIDGAPKTLADPNPDFTPDEVMSFYANTYPELTTATVSGPEVVNDECVFSFQTTVGTKA